MKPAIIFGLNFPVPTSGYSRDKAGKTRATHVSELPDLVLGMRIFRKINEKSKKKNITVPK